MSEIGIAAVLGLLAGSLAALAVGRAGSRDTATAVVSAGAIAAACALLAAAALHRVPPPLPQPDDVPLRTPDSGDVSSSACRSCHPEQYASWHASYHRTMTQVATPAAVLGNFADAQVQFGATHYRMFERGGEFFAETNAPLPGTRDPSRPVTVKLVQTTGSHHMQIYWVASGAGRLLDSLPLVWLRDQQRWIPRPAVFVTPPSERPATGSTWNYTCIGCHSTHPRPRFALAGEGEAHADSQITELGIACEACHGAGERHTLAYRSPLERYRQHLSDEPDAAIANPARLSHVRSTQVCGQCHAVKTFYSVEHVREWVRSGWRFRPGDDLDAVASIVSRETLARPFIQQIMRDVPDFVSGSFWDDGIVRVTGREYNALLESGCYQRGELSCISCHEMHQATGDRRPRWAWADDQLAPGMDSDRACTQCHESYRDDRRAAEHTHHGPNSSGSACQNCHMPHTAYGLLKAVRAHEIHSPRVLTSGPGSARPNACNLCHLDRSLGWSADYLARWYGQEPPELSDDDRRVAAGVRWALTGDAGVRALVAWSMGWAPAHEAAGTHWLVPYLVELMDDRYDAVRMIATRSLGAIPGFERADYDPLASADARAAAARELRERAVGFALAGPRPGAAALFDAQGRILADEFARLRAQRDERPLTLAE